MKIEEFNQIILKIIDKGCIIELGENHAVYAYGEYVLRIEDLAYRRWVTIYNKTYYNFKGHKEVIELYEDDLENHVSTKPERLSNVI